MQKRQFHLHDGKSGAAITVHVSHRSGQTEIRGIQEDGTIHIHQPESPNQETANRALLEFLSGVLQVKITQLEIVAGSAGFDKLITILDLDKETVHRRVAQHVAR